MEGGLDIVGKVERDLVLVLARTVHHDLGSTNRDAQPALVAHADAVQQRALVVQPLAVLVNGLVRVDEEGDARRDSLGANGTEKRAEDCRKDDIGTRLCDPVDCVACGIFRRGAATPSGASSNGRCGQQLLQLQCAEGRAFIFGMGSKGRVCKSRQVKHQQNACRRPLLSWHGQAV